MGCCLCAASIRSLAVRARTDRRSSSSRSSSIMCAVASSAARTFCSVARVSGVVAPSRGSGAGESGASDLATELPEGFLRVAGRALCFQQYGSFDGQPSDFNAELRPFRSPALGSEFSPGLIWVAFPEGAERAADESFEEKNEPLSPGPEWSQRGIQYSEAASKTMTPRATAILSSRVSCFRTRGTSPDIFSTQKSHQFASHAPLVISNDNRGKTARQRAKAANNLTWMQEVARWEPAWKQTFLGIDDEKLLKITQCAVESVLIGHGLPPEPAKDDRTMMEDLTLESREFSEGRALNSRRGPIIRDGGAAGIDREVALPYCLHQIPADIREPIRLLSSSFVEAAIALNTIGDGLRARGAGRPDGAASRSLQALRFGNWISGSWSLLGGKSGEKKSSARIRRQ
jgi:hypothetical protein